MPYDFPPRECCFQLAHANKYRGQNATLVPGFAYSFSARVQLATSARLAHEGADLDLGCSLALCRPATPSASEGGGGRTSARRRHYGALLRGRRRQAGRSTTSALLLPGGQRAQH